MHGSTATAATTTVDLAPVITPLRRFLDFLTFASDGWVRPLMAGLVLLSGLLATARAFFSGKPWMLFLEDDVYYYLKVAQSLAHGHGSTSNGIVATNGYHPLWELTLTAFSFFSTNGWAIFGFVATIAIISSLTVFFLANILMAQAPMGVLLRNSFAAYLAIYSLHIFYTGMEVILAVPLMFVVMVLLQRRNRWQGSFWKCIGFGLVASAMVLSRLDLSIFAALLVFFVVVNGEVRRTFTAKQTVGIAIGLTPVLAYLLMNHVVFGLWMPVSGMAKQLKFTHAPSLKPWLSVYSNNFNNWVNQGIVHLAVLALPFVWKRLRPMQKVIFPAALLFPFVYFFLLSCLSDWQLWIWYLYPLRAALCVSFIIFSLVLRDVEVFYSPMLAAAVFVIVVVEVGVSKWWTSVQPAIYAAAVEIEQFSRTHPGVYAMGDRSGMVAYLMPYKVIQTEGLMMDKTFLEHIHHQDPLLPTLAGYGVHYYVGTAWQPYTGCFHAVEPFQAGKTSAHMEGDLCMPPLFTSTHEFYQTLIFDISKPGAQGEKVAAK